VLFVFVSQVGVEFRADGYLPSSGPSQILGASSTAAELGRFAWDESAAFSSGSGGTAASAYCVDVTTGAWASPALCAPSTNLCAAFASMFNADSAEADSFCACYDAGKAPPSPCEAPLISSKLRSRMPGAIC